MLPFLLASCIVLSLLNQPPITHSLQDPKSPLVPNQCNEKCGKFRIPYPFHLNTSCASISNSFLLSCLNSTTLFLNISSQRYQVLEFFSDGILVDFPGTTVCRQYKDLNSFGFAANEFFAVSVDNVIGLYDCEDSSLCKADCETIDLPGCEGNSRGGTPGCCYPLSDHSVWQMREEFSVFSKFGCRGFSCWAVSRGSNTGKRGVKLEWAVPLNSSKGVCAKNADFVNATAVKAGARCSCRDGFVGDGFANGTGCLESCIKNGQEINGEECHRRKHSQRKVVIVAGVLAPAFVIASLVALFCLLKRPVKPGKFGPDQAHFHSPISFRKACRTRLFTYHELQEATKGFAESQKLADASIYAGVLADGSHIAIHKAQCENEKDLIQALSRIEIFSIVSHKNMAHLLGCCIDSGYTPLVVYEYPANGTFEEHLNQGRGQSIGLDWYKRLSIATETASVLAYLQCEISPPIFHHNLKSCYIFLDEDFSAKIAGFGLISHSSADGSNSYDKYESYSMTKRDVYNFGVMLIEIITGSKNLEQPPLALQKIRSGKLEEIVDPSLYYHEQAPFRREQIEIVADIATRCMLFGGEGKIRMIDVARELVHITKESIDAGSKRGPALEETFSNSSLLQMISMSPDSIYVP